MELRPYQQKAVDAVKKEWEEGHKKTLLVLPTGTGKTVVFSKIVEDCTKDGSRALILAHRGELLEQAADKLTKVSGLYSALEKAESTSLGSFLPVTVGSIQTLSQEKRLTQFPKDHFKTIVIDECHHSSSDSYQRVLNYFEGANVLGVTATPDRGDQKSLGKYFDSKAYEYTMHQAIKEGYLCPVRAQMIPLELDISKVGMSNGDYAVGEMGTALEPYLHQIVFEMSKYCKGKKTVVFLPLVKTSQKFCELLKAQGFRAAEVNGNSPDRDQILKDFADGKYEVLCNSMLLSEGWDQPDVDCISILRATRSRSLYQQMVGRGMRLAPNKKDLLLLDFLWLTEKHDLCRPASLISKDENIAKRINKMMVDNNDGIDLLDAEDKAERDIIREREEALARELEAMKKRKQRLVDPIQYAFSIESEDLMNYQPVFAWEMAPASQKQLDYLEKHGIYPDSITCSGMANMIIDKLKMRQYEGLATPKQVALLERYSFRRVGMWSFDAASKMISRLSENHWRLPHGIDAPNYQPA